MYRPCRYFQLSAEAACPPMIKIFVGPERKLRVLPEQLLCDRVKFFKSAFQSGFRESKRKSSSFRKIVQLPLGTSSTRYWGLSTGTRANSVKATVLDSSCGAKSTFWLINWVVIPLLRPHTITRQSSRRRTTSVGSTAKNYL
jgi:hypothetical protein